MVPCQVVIDTNVMVSAYRSRKGAAFELVRRIGDPRFKLNVSTALLLEYEAKLKAAMATDGLTDLWKVDRFLDVLAAMAHRRSIYFSFRSEEFHAGDAFIVDLAIASGARFVITYNLRHFTGLKRYGRIAMRPRDFLRLLEATP